MHPENNQIINLTMRKLQITENKGLLLPFLFCYSIVITFVLNPLCIDKFMQISNTNYYLFAEVCINLILCAVLSKPISALENEEDKVMCVLLLLCTTVYTIASLLASV